MEKKFKVNVRDVWYSVEIIDLNNDQAVVLIDGEEIAVQIVNDVVETVSTFSVVEKMPVSSKSSEPVSSKKISAPKIFKSPMPGVILSVAHKEGDSVITGDEVCVLEAMKMQQTLKAEWSGVVKKMYVKAGDQVLDGDPILELK